MSNQSVCSRISCTETSKFPCLKINVLISLTVRPKAPVCSQLIAAIVGSNPAESVNVRLLCLLCVE
jgi:hypothetical protein